MSFFIPLRTRFFQLSALSCVLFFSGCGSSSNTNLDAISAIMNKPRYASANAQWSMVVMDVETGRILDSINPDRLSYTGSVRKIFSVGTLLNKVGKDKRFDTAVYKLGNVDAQGVLSGNLVLKAAGDITFGGRMKADGSVDFTEFDHGEAQAFQGAILTPGDPLTAINDLASQVKAAGINSITGDVIIDDRLFDTFVVPNGDVVISSILINENLIDITLNPNATAGQPGLLDWRPKTSAYTILGTSTTTAAGSDPDISVSGAGGLEGHLNCFGQIGCAGTISAAGSLLAPALIPLDYRAVFVGNGTFVGTLKIDDPATFARAAFIDALINVGVTVTAPSIALNNKNPLPAIDSYAPSTQVASFLSAPYSEVAKLILKVSQNTGANLSLMQLGATEGKRTVQEALAVERHMLVDFLGLNPAAFNFPTNGSGSPDSQASAYATAKLLRQMTLQQDYDAYRAAFPILGTDGTATGVGRSVIGKEHIVVKSGATISGGQFIAMTNAGYIDAKSGHRLAYALFVNNAGPFSALSEATEIFEDEAQILGLIYKAF